MDKNQRRGSMSVPRDDGRLLRMLAESLGAKHVVELGTSYGYSGVWFCLALRKTGGKLTTYEIDPQRAATARNNFKRAGVTESVTIVEGDAHKEVTKLKEPVDLVFIDADKEGYADYLNKLLPLCVRAALSSRIISIAYGRSWLYQSDHDEPGPGHGVYQCRCGRAFR